MVNLLCRYVYDLLACDPQFFRSGDSNRWVLVCIGIIDRHVLEMPLEEPLKEIFNNLKAKVRVNEYRANIGFRYIRETLSTQLTPILC